MTGRLANSGELVLPFRPTGVGDAVKYERSSETFFDNESLFRSHPTNTCGGEVKGVHSGQTAGRRSGGSVGAADLLTACVVVSLVTARCGDAPSSRRAGSQNLWPRHPHLFMGCLS